MDLILPYLNETGFNPVAFTFYLVGIVFLSCRMSISWAFGSSVMPGKDAIECFLIFIVAGVFMQFVDLGLVMYAACYIEVGLWVLIATLVLSLFNGKAKEFISEVKAIKQGPFSDLMDAIKKESKINGCMRIIILRISIVCFVVILQILVSLLFALLAFSCLWPLKLSYVLVRLITCPDCNGFMFKNKRKHINCDLNKLLKAATKLNKE